MTQNQPEIKSGNKRIQGWAGPALISTNYIIWDQIVACARKFVQSENQIARRNP